jgi:plasmid segregation protein ParM
MPYIIKNGLNNKNKYKSIEVINEVMRDHVNDIKKQVMKNKWDIDNIDIHFVGGGSIILEKYIGELFPHATITDNIFDNVKGFYNIGAMTYGYD